MSRQLISRSPDLKRLRDEGYAVFVRDNYLLVSDVPYVDESRTIQRGTIVSELTLAGDITAQPSDHTIMFQGSEPCDNTGNALGHLINQRHQQQLTPTITIDFMFSHKPVDPAGARPYTNYYEKVTAYISILTSYASLLDPNCTAKTFPIMAVEDDDMPFAYLDTASSRSNIRTHTSKLTDQRVAIVGVGGTGSYIVDQVAKTPVREIHLWDGDILRQHNAFRAPGAVGIDSLRASPNKAAYFASLYANMHRGIIPHGNHVTGDNFSEIAVMDFVFIAIDGGASRNELLSNLIQHEVPFIDVGIGVGTVDDMLEGLARVTYGAPSAVNDSRLHLSTSPIEDEDDYHTPVQIADMNMLTAALAVIKWKKHMGFYVDLENEFHSIYTIDGNCIINATK